jgi:tyrosine-protein kinase Etk/Wzc
MRPPTVEPRRRAAARTSRQTKQWHGTAEDPVAGVCFIPRTEVTEPANAAPEQTAESRETSLLDLALVLAENARLLVIAPLVVGVLALGYAFTITPIFIAKSTFLPPQQQAAASAALQSLGALAGLAGVTNTKSPTDQYVALLKSRTVIDRMIDRFDLMKVYQSQYREHARYAIETSIKATTGKEGLISVEVEDEDPQRAAAIANALIEELGILLGHLALTEAQQRRLFFEKQLKDTKDALTRSQVALQSSGINMSTLKTQPQAAVTEVAQLKARITSQEVAIESMSSYLSETSTDFQRARSDLVALKRQLAKIGATDPVAGADAEYIVKYREYKYQETLFDLFARQFEMAKLDESRDGSTIQVVDRAIAPELKSRPRKGLIAIVATLATGLALILFLFARAAVRATSADAAAAAKMTRLKGALWVLRR